MKQRLSIIYDKKTFVTCSTVYLKAKKVCIFKKSYFLRTAFYLGLTLQYLSKNTTN